MSGKEVVFLTPAYEKLTTLMPEYQFEQVDFDANALWNRIK